MITLINYGIGNLQAFLNLYQRLHIPVKVATTEAEILQATKLILPGVGHFDYAMQLFNASPMKEAVVKKVMDEGTPILGICVGMQMLAHSSDEGEERGLGWVPGRVRSFSSVLEEGELPLPHMGWNDVIPERSVGLFKDFDPSDSRFYFLHSYFFECEQAGHSLARTDYGLNFSCAVGKDNVYGVQFHPEKSHHFGEQLLRNFAEL
ncbi:MAG: imidazole glycerol phosphate synthase subunit HisH [Gammaproteobacteria bacterium]|nr:imidazole glycerol phosphate synthase subunit HisH [Gammaproteobacteria bacterium]MBU2058449.1 imidazole glycerol phosphate synthase subunit HisH [Gammaproteobacteria bacterium]MBU2176498.1 imidazole glycerol phosphate synthase subunit HisH [Gammaproteobacteria bacterium]MBU2248560.1 imidazole glycerol phosphate synthase subunit HisH [Gammaproteobacteria bacterium]MBU2345577.1 imidazole glycerol phosphate synthase subunit HisH [Gammaproteobacteria bacterium]